ncbi:KdsC family phosphatase [Chitinasiproducens palmae]|uniref:3-deoxy-D-manno-octulosonate 8-phosphate phosphatase KdsC n=1 Tax=Chitinasiproducens palmae TaxID=1770053 RepID=A0A1H2PNE1_9BURK|nr:3-deoxy-D-manno-octulosonate 8-phosphate phosphatase [Chitinasiproducens palmae]SDV48201.1 3-deoxy-D-manno-octulosonate 8-phosphate phosphatase (KDO 8-P phosphatase) [Chitinasiproducens palmae]
MTTLTAPATPDHADCMRRAAAVELMIFDVDGVLTDGRVYFGAEGEMLKAFNILDGQGIKLLQRAGIRTALITGRRSPMVARRAAELGIDHVAQGIGDKRAALDTLLAECGLTPAQAGHMGDDWPDLPVMCCVGFAACPANAHAAVAARAHFRTARSGGHGAVRDVCDLLLQARGVYDTLLDAYCRPGAGDGAQR